MVMGAGRYSRYPHTLIRSFDSNELCWNGSVQKNCDLVRKQIAILTFRCGSKMRCRKTRPLETWRIAGICPEQFVIGFILRRKDDRNMC